MAVAGRRSSRRRRLRAERQLEQGGGLGQAVDDVERLDRLARGALDEVVEHADREDAAVALVEPAQTRASLLPRMCFVAGGASTTDTNGSAA